MADNSMKKRLALHVAEEFFAWVDAGVIGRTEAEEIADLIAEAVKETNNVFRKRGHGGWLRKVEAPRA